MFVNVQTDDQKLIAEVLRIQIETGKAAIMDDGAQAYAAASHNALGRLR